jgi:biopolymer transport protein ExbD
MPFNSKKKLVAVLAGLACCAILLSWYVGQSTPLWSEAAAMQTSSSTSHVEVRIDSEKKIHIGDAKTTLETLTADLQRASDRGPEHVVTRLRCPDDLPMGVLFQVQNILTKGGFTKVSYERGEEDGLPLVLPTQELVETMKSIPAEQIVSIGIAPTGEVTFAGKSVAVDELDRDVAGALQANPKLIFSIRAEPDARYGTFFAVLRQVKAGSAQRIFIDQPAMD